MFVYSEISWDEIRSRPIFLACVSTCRYRDRRAATPTVSRSATSAPSLDVICDTAQLVCHHGSDSRREKSQAGLRSPRLCADRAPQALGGHVVEERPPPVDLDHRQEHAVALLELGDAGDVHLLELEAELVPSRDDRLARPLAQMAPAGAVEHDPTDTGPASSSPPPPASPPRRRRTCASARRSPRASPRSPGSRG